MPTSVENLIKSKTLIFQTNPSPLHGVFLSFENPIFKSLVVECKTLTTSCGFHWQVALLSYSFLMISLFLFSIYLLTFSLSALLLSPLCTAFPYYLLSSLYFLCSKSILSPSISFPLLSLNNSQLIMSSCRHCFLRWNETAPNDRKCNISHSDLLPFSEQLSRHGAVTDFLALYQLDEPHSWARLFFSMSCQPLSVPSVVIHTCSHMPLFLFPCLCAAWCTQALWHRSLAIKTTAIHRREIWHIHTNWLWGHFHIWVRTIIWTRRHVFITMLRPLLLV